MFAGHIDHAARVMRVITWNRSFKGAPNGDGAKDDYAPEDYETHATVLDKLLAWEKKLYEEVKVCCCFLIIRVILRFPSHSKGTLHIKKNKFTSFVSFFLFCGEITWNLSIANPIHFMQFSATLRQRFFFCSHQ